MHTLALLLFICTFLVLDSQALIVPIVKENNVRWRRTTSQATETPPAHKWTNETTFALLGVCATVSCFTIGLTWPRLRRCCTSRRKDSELDPSIPMVSLGVYDGHHGPSPVNPNISYQQQGSPSQGHYNQSLVPDQYAHAHGQYGLFQSPYQQLPFYNSSPVHRQYERLHNQNQNIKHQQQYPHFHYQSLNPPYSHNPNYRVLQQHYGAPAPYDIFVHVPARER